MYKTSENLKRDIAVAQKSNKPVVFLGGDCSDGNDWRRDVRGEFDDRIFFLDPYEPDWDPKVDIYNELTGILVADHVVFYRGGKGSAKEKAFIDTLGKVEYQEFDDLDSLKKHLAEIVSNHAAVRAALERVPRPIVKLIPGRPPQLKLRQQDVFRSGPRTHTPGKGLYQRPSPQEKKRMIEDR